MVAAFNPKEATSQLKLSFHLNCFSPDLKLLVQKGATFETDVPVVV